MAKKRKQVRSKKPKMPPPRLKDVPEVGMTYAQRHMRDSIVASRGLTSPKLGGPFAVWLHAPEFGDLVQRVGAHCRYKSALPPRLSEFAILAIAGMWRAQYEWFAHAATAEKAGVKKETLRDLRAGKTPRKAAKDERAIYDFIAELHRTRRVSDKTYASVHRLLGDKAMVELVGILGYYTLVSMTLDVFRVPLPEGQALPFREKAR
jgi:4-carboxymuconolactone decarboxylase